jgi:hypothetical protein
MKLVKIERSEIAVLNAVTRMPFKKAAAERKTAFTKPGARTTRTT